MKNFDLIEIILKWKKTLAIVAAVAVILASVFSAPAFIKPKYKSTAILYPSNLMSYSEETPTEQMLQLFQSDSIFNHIAKKFNLVKHYDLDSTSPILRYELMKMYTENVSIKKTEYEAVIIEALDINPVTASDIIKEMIRVFNISTIKLQQAKSEEVVAILKNQLRRKQNEIDSITTAVKELAVKFGLIDYSAQSKQLSKEYYKALGSGNEKKINELTNAMRNLEERGGQFHTLQSHLNSSTSEYDYIWGELNKAVRDMNKQLTYTNVLVKPIPADKKSYPIRWLIVVAATFSALFFTLIIISVLEGRKNN